MIGASVNLYVCLYVYKCDPPPQKRGGGGGTQPAVSNPLKMPCHHLIRHDMCNLVFPLDL